MRASTPSTPRRETFAPVIGMPIACRVVEGWCPESMAKAAGDLGAQPKPAMPMQTMPMQTMHPEQVGSTWTSEADQPAP